MTSDLTTYIDTLELGEEQRSTLTRLIIADENAAKEEAFSTTERSNARIAELNAQLSDLQARYNAEKSAAFGAIAYAPPVLEVVSYG